MTGPQQPAARRPCPACGRDDRATHTLTAEASHATIAVLAEGFPLEVCTCGEVEVTLSVRMATETAWRQALSVAQRRRLRADACAGCGAALSMPVRRTTRAVTVTPDDAPVATLRFDLPMQRCGDCGHDQVPDRSHADIPGAVEAVLLAAIAVARSPRAP